MGKSPKNSAFYAIGFILIFIILIIWELSIRFGFIPILVLPKPSAVFTKGIALIGTKDFLYNLYFTLIKWFLGFIVGTSIGLSIGFISGINKRIEQTVLPISAFLRSVPPIALFPIFLIILGPGVLPITIVGILYVAIYVFPIASHATEVASNKFEELSIILNLSKTEFIKIIVIPATLISTVVSSRIAASFLFAIIIAGEIIIGGNKGIGTAINEYSQKYKLEEAYFYILVTGLIGLLIDLVLTKVQKISSKRLL